MRIEDGTLMAVDLFGGEDAQESSEIENCRSNSSNVADGGYSSSGDSNIDRVASTSLAAKSGNHGISSQTDDEEELAWLASIDDSRPIANTTATPATTRPATAVPLALGLLALGNSPKSNWSDEDNDVE